MIFKTYENSIPIDDISDLIPKWVKTNNDLNSVEAENILIAKKLWLKKAKTIYPQNWFNIIFLKKIHFSMFSNVWIWAGKFRKTIKSIGIQPYLITSSLSELCTEVNAWNISPVELTFLEKAAIIHHKLVFIHPFENGNGRFARLIADKYLFSYGCLHPNWPKDLNKKNQNQKDYINCLKKADYGCIDALVNYMYHHGAKEPSSDILNSKTYNCFSSKQRKLIVKAFERRKINY